jgi:hypothetical protein
MVLIIFGLLLKIRRSEVLFSLNEIRNYQLRAQDGDLGEINSFLIDDFNWVVRYVVVNVDRRNILLSVFALSSPEPAGRIIPTSLTRDKILNSPEIDLNQPLSREIERQLSDYYSWPYYWEPGDIPTTQPGDLSAVPLIEMELDKEAKEDQTFDSVESNSTDASGKSEYHLHSTKVLFGETIHATNDDKNAGKLADMIAQDKDWNILYLVVETGGLLGGAKVLVSPNWVKTIDDLDKRIDVELTSGTIQNSPGFNTIEDITEEYQAGLNNYYSQK